MDLIDKLINERRLDQEEMITLLTQTDVQGKEKLREEAYRLRTLYYGNRVYTRGLIEYSNYCKNNCYYCGIRCANTHAVRYRLTKEEILMCCKQGYAAGFRTFVLQGGEDPYFNDARMVDIVQSIRSEYPDCAITLSLGERSYDSYKKLKEAGADRYLLRHETANATHYGMLHPKEMQLSVRKECLRQLKELGYQVGAGMMIGAPGQTPEYLAEDLLYLADLQPEMVGTGPFIPHHETPFADEKAGSMEMTLFVLSIVRIMLPKVLLPATTALGTIQKGGREKGMLYGCNVIMPDLSPAAKRKLYALYDHKLTSDTQACETWNVLNSEMEKEGFTLVCDRGDFQA